MQFFFLLLFNVFLGAVLYLIISLKLERTATEYRERRFRKEMDEIIREFNLTAERNITILESRIRVMRRLLEKTGDLKSIDFLMDDDEQDQATPRSIEAAPHSEWPANEGTPGRGDTVMVKAGKAALVAGEMAKKGLLILFDRINTIFPRSGAGLLQSPVVSAEDAGPPALSAQVEMEARNNAPVLIEKDLSEIAPPVDVEPPVEERMPLTESQIG